MFALFLMQHFLDKPLWLNTLSMMLNTSLNDRVWIPQVLLIFSWIRCCALFSWKPWYQLKTGLPALHCSLGCQFINWLMGQSSFYCWILLSLSHQSAVVFPRLMPAPSIIHFLWANDLSEVLNITAHQQQQHQSRWQTVTFKTEEDGWQQTGRSKSAPVHNEV